jgi:hypothetical protein
VEYFCGVKLKSVEGVFECSELESKCVEVPDEAAEEIKLSEDFNVKSSMTDTIELLEALINSGDVYNQQQILNMKSAQLLLIEVFGHADIKRS